MNDTDVRCPACGTTEIHGTRAGPNTITLTCDECGHQWARRPGVSCPRCTSGDPYVRRVDGWQYDDLAEAREDTMAAYDDVTYDEFRCRKCNHVWRVEVSRRTGRTPKPIVSVDQVWARIEAYQGETFRQIQGGEFTYEVRHRSVVPDRTNRQIPKSNFDEALGLVPLRTTVPVQHLQGPSYIFAILMDDRVRAGDW